MAFPASARRLGLALLAACGGPTPDPSTPAGTPTGAPSGLPTGTLNPLYADDDGDGQSEFEGDCDDTDPTVFVGAAEIPGDGVDSNCDNADVAVWPLDDAATFSTQVPFGVGWLGLELAVLDADRDGRQDLLAGAPGNIVGLPSNYVYLFLGRSDSVIDGMEPVVFTGPDGSGFGGMIDPGLDLTGDGEADPLIGSYHVEHPDGGAFILVDPANSWNPSQAAGLAWRGTDVPGKLTWSAAWPDDNGDGVGEILGLYFSTWPTVDLRIFRSPHVGRRPPEDGELVATYDQVAPFELFRTPDLDGDGLPELLSQDGWGTLAGVDLQAGGALTPWWTSELAFSLSNRAFGDITGDGLPDVAAGNHTRDSRGDRESGAVFLLRGPPPPTTTSAEGEPKIEGAAPLDWMGISGGTIGDLDGDGQADLVVGAPGDAYETRLPGRVHIFYGPITTDRTVEQADLVITGSLGGEWFGRTSAIGDLDADGIPDLVVGAPLADEGGADDGKIYLFSGVDLP